MKFLKHFFTITKHKILVMKYCFKVGLYKQGILHDISKYSWTEFKIGIKYYQGSRSPNNAEREDTGCSTAWLHHKGRNKHHFEYWFDYSLDKNKIICGMKMPVKYTVEMFIDRIAASKIYLKDKYTNKSPLEYYERSKAHSIMHTDTRILLKRLLVFLAENGEDKAFSYARYIIKRYK